MTTPQPRKRLPVNPSLEHLQKQAKRLVKQTTGLKLTQAQHQLAREYGFTHWAELVAAIQSRASEMAILHQQLEAGAVVPPTALHTAAQSGHVEAVRLLLDHGADPNALDASGNTPLWRAAQGPAKTAERRMAAIELLLNAGADLHRRCEGGATALHVAASGGPAELVFFLLSRGARNWIPDENGKLPVDYARENPASPGKEAIVQLFSGPRMDDPVFRQAVDAMTAGDLRKVRRLLREHPDLIRARAEEQGEYAGAYFCRPTLLHFIAENPTRTGRLPDNMEEIAQALVEAGAEVDAVTLGDSDAGGTTLALVATSEPARKQNLQLPLIELLVKNGADPRKGYFAAIIHRERAALELLVRLAGGEHTLLSAVSLGNLAEVRKFLALSATERERAEAANVAVMEGDLDCVRIILDTGLGIEVRIPHHPYAPTLLHQAASFGRAEIVDFLLERGADPTLTDSQFRGTAADWAHHAGQAELEGRLRQAERDFLKRRGEKMDKLIIAAAIENDLPTLQRLLDAHPEKINLTGGPWNKPLLHCAAWEGHLAIVLELLKRGMEVNTRCESDHACAIHFAAERGHLEVVRALVEAGADIEAPDNDHQLNVLGWATSIGRCRQEVARFLLSCGASMSLWSAIALNEAEVVRSLVRADRSVLQTRMSRNEHRRTPLHHAVDRNQPEMVALLLELGADAQAKDSLGLGPVGASNDQTDAAILQQLSHTGPLTLHESLILERFDLAEAALALEPDAIKPGGTQTHLFVHMVVRRNWAAAEWLLEHGADINAIAEVYECPATALHFAIESAPLEKISWLLERGADASIKDRKYEADAFGWADFFGKPEITELLQKGRKKI